MFSFVTFCQLDCNVQAVWSCEPVPNGVRLSHRSPDGDEGYPGNLKVSVTYTLEENTLSVQYCARTDQITPINLTNHSYFNLAGQVRQGMCGHKCVHNAKSLSITILTIFLNLYHSIFDLI